MLVRNRIQFMADYTRVLWMTDNAFSNNANGKMLCFTSAATVRQLYSSVLICVTKTLK
jgi:hypothetical protein